VRDCQLSSSAQQPMRELTAGCKQPMRIRWQHSAAIRGYDAQRCYQDGGICCEE